MSLHIKRYMSISMIRNIFAQSQTRCDGVALFRYREGRAHDFSLIVPIGISFEKILSDNYKWITKIVFSGANISADASQERGKQI